MQYIALFAYNGIVEFAEFIANKKNTLTNPVGFDRILPVVFINEHKRRNNKNWKS